MLQVLFNGGTTKGEICRVFLYFSVGKNPKKSKILRVCSSCNLPQFVELKRSKNIEFNFATTRIYETIFPLLAHCA